MRKYRAGNSGTAYTKSDDWGIEAPHPRGSISFAVFAHEVGHQLLHRSDSKPRWLEEIEAWEFAFSCFERFELRGVERARERAAKSLVYAAVKALRNPRTSEATRQRLRRRYAWVWQVAGPIGLQYEVWL